MAWLKEPGDRHGDGVPAERVPEVGPDDPEIGLEAVALGVFLAEQRIARAKLDAGELHRGIAGEKAKGGNTGADSRLEHRFARGTGNGGGEEHRIDPGPEALLGLQDPQPSAKEAILGEGRRHIAGGRWERRVRCDV
jgi:hypothetical protein